MAEHHGDDLECFRRAMAENDLGHAVHHLAGLASEGRSTRVDAAIAQFAAASDAPVDWVPLREKVFVGEVVVRAVLLARAGRHVDAVPLLFMAQSARPEADFLAWAEEWFADRACVEALSLDDTVSTAMRVSSHPELAPRILALLEILRTAREPHGPLALTVARLVRTGGDVERAIAIAEEEHGRAPSYFTSIARASAHREHGDVERAVAAYRDAIGFDPSDLSARLDIGDLALETGDLDAAAQAYAEVLEREDKHEWAWPSQMYIVAREGDEVGRAVLRALADGGNDRARQLYGRLEPFAIDLEPPSASLVNLALDASARGLVPTGRVSVSALEAPSAVAVLRELLGPDVAIAFGETAPPDPRLPREAVALQVWTYDGDVARPALPRPRDEVRDAIAKIATQPWVPARWNEQARSLARTLRPEDANDVLATMVHPPETPVGAPPHVFRFHVQVAAASVACRIDEASPWSGSLRERVMHALVNGPLDWTTTAAIVALTELATEAPDLASAIRGDLLTPLVEISQSAMHYQCVIRPLVHCLLRFPNTPPELREVLLGLRDDLDRG